MFRHLLRAVVPGVVAFVAGEPEAFDLVARAERLRREADGQRIVRGAIGSDGLTERPNGCCPSTAGARGAYGCSACTAGGQAVRSPPLTSASWQRHRHLLNGLVTSTIG